MGWKENIFKVTIHRCLESAAFFLFESEDLSSSIRNIEDNPADLASRGVNPEDFANSTLWCHGSSFLCMDKNYWAQQNHTELGVDEKASSELKPKSPFIAATVITNDIFNALFENVSSLSKIADIERINNGKFVKAKSSISSLSPFLDEKGILRVEGRLQNSQLSFNAKHPVIIPGVWPLGNDGIVRVVRVKISNDYLKRPIVKLSPLP
ncbi:hypothetical protein NPIL_370941 [Nephila pilipes]|uniref:DUF5641 domain-containing protein n=1 Tax=Nephila pilipes TaxID=299642 RepID=A0A8X6UJK5_NEPPI|nr:hypothetical protein NPIL_370941 [Nephila pilipes]